MARSSRSLARLIRKNGNYMSHQEYVWAWAIYLCSSTVLFAVFYYVTSKLAWAELRQLLRVVLAVILFVPWYTDAQQDYLSPAWLISIADVLLYESKSFWRAGLALVLSLVIAVVLSSAYSIWAWWRFKKQS